MSRTKLYHVTVRRVWQETDETDIAVEARSVAEARRLAKGQVMTDPNSRDWHPQDGGYTRLCTGLVTVFPDADE